MAAAPAAGLDLPQKFLAWQDDDGKVWVAYNSFIYIAHRHKISGMDDTLAVLDSRLEALTSKALQ